MRILSWNLWWRYGPWEQRREAIAATLAEIGPDLCGLQEVWDAPGENLAAGLAERLGMHWCWTAASKERDGLTLGNAILSRWPIAAQAQAALPAGGPAEEGRVALYARIDTPGGALPMFTTHLTYGLGRSQVRVAQVRALAGFVAGHAADPRRGRTRSGAGSARAPILLPAWCCARQAHSCLRCEQLPASYRRS